MSGMTAVPLDNTSTILKSNELLCYYCQSPHCSSKLPVFRLFLPSFPSSQIQASLEVPLLLSRRLCLAIENFFHTSVYLVSTYQHFPESIQTLLRIQRSPQIIRVSFPPKTQNKSILTFAKTKYFVNNKFGSMKVEVFQNIPALSRKCFVENCKVLMEIQNPFLEQLMGYIHLTDQNVFIRMTEHCFTTLESLCQTLLREKEGINETERKEVSTFILAETLICLDNLHERGITHRNLCPKSFGITPRGHLKIGGIFDAMNRCRDVDSFFEQWSETSKDDIGLSQTLNQCYLDPEVLNHFLKNEVLEGYMELDCLSDIFSLAIIMIETISNTNFLDVSIWNNVQESMSLASVDHTLLVKIFLDPHFQLILRHKLSEICEFLADEVYAFILLMIQPKINRMRGMRMNVQRHRYLNSSGCEFKLRMELLKKHPAFSSLNMDDIFVQDSRISRFL